MSKLWRCRLSRESTYRRWVSWVLLEKSTLLDDVVCPFSNGQMRESPALT